MANFDWKKTVIAIAPALGTALGSPLAGMAIATIGNALLGNPEATESEIAVALQKGGPEALAKIKSANNEFALKMKELDIKINELDQKDRDSARKREVDAQDSWTPRILAFVVTFGFFGLLYIMSGGSIFGEIPIESETFKATKDIVNIMLGTLGTAWINVISYYFGSAVGQNRPQLQINKN